MPDEHLITLEPYALLYTRAGAGVCLRDPLTGKVGVIFMELTDGMALERCLNGEYLALRVLIGEAAGRNWWCVVFPPLCTAAASDVPAVALDAGLTDREVALITEADEGYVLKFKSVELWQALKAKLSR